jgi:hypothetical protein
MGAKISVPERIHRASKLNDIGELQVCLLLPVGPTSSTPTFLQQLLADRASSCSKCL